MISTYLELRKQEGTGENVKNVKERRKSGLTRPITLRNPSPLSPLSPKESNAGERVPLEILRRPPDRGRKRS